MSKQRPSMHRLARWWRRRLRKWDRCNLWPELEERGRTKWPGGRDEGRRRALNAKLEHIRSRPEGKGWSVPAEWAHEEPELYVHLRGAVPPLEAPPLRVSKTGAVGKTKITFKLEGVEELARVLREHREQLVEFIRRANRDNRGGPRP